jgi:hypothetical protein
MPIRSTGSRLVLNGDRVNLPPAYTPLFIVGPTQEHLLETRVAAGPSVPGTADEAHTAETRSREVWPLSPVERLVLVCLSQRYLRQEPAPQPLTWAPVAHDLGALQPTAQWTWRRAAHAHRELANGRTARVRPPEPRRSMQTGQNAAGQIVRVRVRLGPVPLPRGRRR